MIYMYILLALLILMILAELLIDIKKTIKEDL